MAHQGKFLQPKVRNNTHTLKLVLFLTAVHNKSTRDILYDQVHRFTQSAMGSQFINKQMELWERMAERSLLQFCFPHGINQLFSHDFKFR